MLSRRTIRRSRTGVLQTAVWTTLPCHVMSLGRPTLTESKRAITSFRTAMTAIQRERDKGGGEPFTPSSYFPAQKIRIRQIEPTLQALGRRRRSRQRCAVDSTHAPIDERPIGGAVHQRPEFSRAREFDLEEPGLPSAPVLTRAGTPVSSSDADYTDVAVDTDPLVIAAEALHCHTPFASLSSSGDERERRP